MQTCSVMLQKTNENHWVKGRRSKDYITTARNLSQSDAQDQNELTYKVLGSLSLRKPEQRWVTVEDMYSYLHLVGDCPLSSLSFQPLQLDPLSIGTKTSCIV